jgi:prefoldin subunit 5
MKFFKNLFSSSREIKDPTYIENRIEFFMMQTRLEEISQSIKTLQSSIEAVDNRIDILYGEKHDS